MTCLRHVARMPLMWWLQQTSPSASATQHERDLCWRPVCTSLRAHLPHSQPQRPSLIQVGGREALLRATVWLSVVHDSVSNPQPWPPLPPHPPIRAHMQAARLGASHLGLSRVSLSARTAREICTVGKSALQARRGRSSRQAREAGRDVRLSPLDVQWNSSRFSTGL